MSKPIWVHVTVPQNKTIRFYDTDIRSKRVEKIVRTSLLDFQPVDKTYATIRTFRQLKDNIAELDSSNGSISVVLKKLDGSNLDVTFGGPVVEKLQQLFGKHFQIIFKLTQIDCVRRTNSRDGDQDSTDVLERLRRRINAYRKRHDLPNGQRAGQIQNQDLPNRQRAGQIQNQDLPNRQRAGQIQNQDLPNRQRAGQIQNQGLPNRQRAGQIQNQDIPNAQQAGRVQNNNPVMEGLNDSINSYDYRTSLLNWQRAEIQAEISMEAGVAHSLKMCLIDGNTYSLENSISGTVSGDNLSMEIKNMPLAWAGLGSESGFEYSGQLTLSIAWNACRDIKTASSLPGGRSFSQNVEEGNRTEVTLFGRDGYKLNCPKSLLTESSIVFQAMLGDTKFQEGNTGIVNIPDLGEDSLNALLAYLRDGDLDAIENSFDIALELLHAAETYALDILKVYLEDIFLNKPEDWFTIDGVYCLNEFVKNVEELSTVKARASELVNIFSEEVIQDWEWIPNSDFEISESLINLVHVESSSLGVENDSEECLTSASQLQEAQSTTSN